MRRGGVLGGDNGLLNSYDESGEMGELTEGEGDSGNNGNNPTGTRAQSFG
jgi:hypothetical protein